MDEIGKIENLEMFHVLKCDDCDKTFRLKRSLNRHKVSHQNPGKFRCDRCGKSFHRLDKFEMHAMTHIRKGTSFVCPVANCTENFGKFEEVQDHLRRFHNILESFNGYEKCKECDNVYRNPDSMLTHFYTRHHEDYKLQIIEVKKEIKKEIKTEPLPEIENRNWKFSDLDLIMPILTMPEASIFARNAKNPNPPTLSPPEAPKIMKSAGNQMTECPQCEVDFEDVTLYAGHRMMHTINHPFECGLCGDVNEDKYGFIAHFLAFHYLEGIQNVE